MTAPPSILWQPQEGPQTALLTCPIREIFYGGARGGGKTDGALGHWSRHRAIYRGMARGILFRRRYKQLDRIVQRGRQLFCNPLLREPAKFLSSKDQFKFVWPDGSELLLRHLEKAHDWEEYQGHEYNWMCFEELTQWPTPELMDKMRACLRDANSVPTWLLATGNPGGPGHTWVKERYIDPAPEGEPFLLRVDANAAHQVMKWAVFIPAKVWDNKLLLNSQPDYIDSLYLSGPEWLVRAWLNGDWDIIAGGYLLGVWNPEQHIVKPFRIPPAWPRWRAMDWGFAKPYSIGWYAMDPDTEKVYRYRELYGYGGQANKGTREEASAVAARIRALESLERKAGIEFRKNPADPACWHGIGTETTIAKIFTEAKVKWTPARTGPDSRVNGAQVVVEYLRTNQFACFDTCRHFLRTVPVIPEDEEKPEDVDTEAEDHVWDEFRYSLVSRHRPRQQEQKPEEPAPFTGAWIEKHGRIVTRH